MLLKTIRDMLVGTIIAGGVTAALAVGTPPTPATGPGLVDGTWLNGLAGGQNATFVSGLTATGTTQATALQLSAGIQLIEIDTVAASTGVALPACVAGTELSIYNNGASTLTVYPQIANNALTAAQDTINNATSFSGGIATHVIVWFACAKNGVWAAK
jgi:hypothetical protein